ncbi:dimethyladenosine transferase 2, mitochondrial isoform X2 [Mobula birostris]|uniref:dimethyladenosine transferase 2, mitochondrial isoform X2 n=1 Tax=Mobula birostris TaxID=1983395 RepID=UPI003B2816A5
MASLSCISVFYILKTTTCRACGCQQVQHSLRLFSCHTGLLGSGAPERQTLNKVKEYSTYCDRTKRSLSALASSVLRKNQWRPLSRFDFMDPKEVQKIIINTEKRHWLRRFIVSPDLANHIVKCIGNDGSENNAIIFECNPGPGVLTRALLNSGAQRIVALESNKHFIPALQSLGKHVNEQLEVVHCDFFKLDPIGRGTMKPPAMFSEKLFNNLGIPEVAWTADIPIKVIGIFPQRNERSLLWKFAYALFERISIFQYGRIEMNMFISEKQYMKITSEPGDMKHYDAFAALWQIACEIELLHKMPDDHLCLVRLTPRKDLFNETLTTFNSTTLVLMLKQCLTKRKTNLINKLESWCPGGGIKLMRQLDLPEDVWTGNVFPEEYKRLFEAMKHSQDFVHSWLYGEVLENMHSTVSHI